MKCSLNWQNFKSQFTAMMNLCGKFESSEILISCVTELLRHFDNHSDQSLVNPETTGPCNTKGLTLKDTDIHPSQQSVGLHHSCNKLSKGEN